jgi:hypothetical protein
MQWPTASTLELHWREEVGRVVGLRLEGVRMLGLVGLGVENIVFALRVLQAERASDEDLALVAACLGRQDFDWRSEVRGAPYLMLLEATLGMEGFVTCERVFVGAD